VWLLSQPLATAQPYFGLSYFFFVLPLSVSVINVEHAPSILVIMYVI
jgi:hypothetical protein